MRYLPLRINIPSHMRSSFPTENCENTIGFCKNPSEITFPIIEKFYIQEFNSLKYFSNTMLRLTSDVKSFVQIL